MVYIHMTNIIFLINEILTLLDLASRMLVMEYADSGSLRSYLETNFSSLTWNDIYSLAYQLACAVSCLHDEGIVHRDLVIYSIIINNVYNLYNAKLISVIYLIAFW